MSDGRYVDFDKLPSWVSPEMAKDLMVKAAESVGIVTKGLTAENIGYSPNNLCLAWNWGNNGDQAIPLFEWLVWIVTQGKKVEPSALDELKKMDISGFAESFVIMHKAIIELDDRLKRLEK